MPLQLITVHPLNPGNYSHEPEGRDMLARLARVLAGCLALAACVPVADHGLVAEKAGPGATPAVEAEAAAEVEVNGGGRR